LDTERALLVVLGVAAISLGLGVIIAMRRATNWDVALREVAGIPGAFLFSGAMLASLALDSLLVTAGFALCLVVSQVVGTLLWFRRRTSSDVVKKPNKNS
jgi:uncharacterized membrane protein HdeD (DUF308 family)